MIEENNTFPSFSSYALPKCRLERFWNFALNMTQVNSAIGSSISKIHIADRGADVYELFFHGYEHHTDLVIRAHFNRKLAQEDSPLWDSISARPCEAVISLWVPDAKGRKKVDVEAEVRYRSVEVLRPLRSKDKYKSVKLTALEVKQKGEVADEKERICWQLLTTLHVESIGDVIRYVRWYSYRWSIERFHYVLKSGTKIEQPQLKQASSLQKAIAVYSLSAFTIMQMVYDSRHYPDVSCEVVLTKQQWMVLYMLINKNSDIPQHPPSFSQAVRWIARLGGHPGRKSDGPPGLKTVWLGYQRVCDAAAVFKLINPKLSI